MSRFARSNLVLLVILALAVLAGAAPAAPPVELPPNATLALLPGTLAAEESGATVSKEIWLLAHNADLTLLLLAADAPVPATWAGALERLETPELTHGELYLVQLADPAEARFVAPARVLWRGGHTVLLTTTAGPPRLTAASRARQHGLLQPVRIALSPKVWPAVRAAAARAVPPGRTEFDPLIEVIVGEVSQVEYVAKWQVLDDFETRYYNTTQNAAASQWMVDVLESYGLQAEFHTYSHNGTRRNVVGILPGLVAPERVVYITGHFDSISEDSQNHAPGADDNGSGTAAFLEAARVLSQYNFGYTIKFVGFNSEEEGLIGSSAYVSTIAGQGEDVVCCFNFDMIAYAGIDPAPPDLIIYTNTASIPFAEVLRDACLEYVPNEVEPVIVYEAISASDHAPFWDHGYPAILGIEEEAWGADFCPWYHTSDDRIEQYPQDYPTQVTAAAIAAVAQTAQPLFTETPYLLLDSYVIDDDASGASQGNGNGTLEYGETIELTVTLTNVGQQDATAVVGTLASEDPFLTLTTAMASFGTVPGSGGAASNAVPYVLEVSPQVPDGHPLALQLLVSEFPDTLELGLAAAAPELAVVAFTVDDALGGDGDGIPEPGETVELAMTLENRGGAAVDDVEGSLGAASVYVTVDPTPHGFGSLDPGMSAAGGPFEVAIDPTCPAFYTTTLQLAATGAGGFAREVPLVLNIGDLFADDMESGEAYWTHYLGGDGVIDEWHLETARNHSFGGTTSWKCGGFGLGDYGHHNHAILESEPFTLPANASLAFWHWMEAEISQTYPDYAYDGGLVEISLEGGSWTPITPEAGYPYLIRPGANPGPFPAETPVFSGTHDWREETFDLSAYAGSARVRFVFGSDGSAAGEGWYLDDLRLRLEFSGAGDLPRAERLRLHPVGPNPLREASSLRLDLPRASEVRVEVYDAAGRCVRTLAAGRLSAGSHRLDWDGRDGAERPVAAGLYWVRARIGEERRTVRLAVVR